MLEQILIPTLIFIALGLLTGILLTIFSKIFAVNVDEKVENIVSVLPGLNCGVCGFSGCENYANNLVKNNASTNKCVPGGDKVARQISEILGKDYCDVEEKIAVVRCGGDVPTATDTSFIYAGEKTCAACNMYYNGKGKCDYGCMGYGDCITKCNFGAITIVDSIAVINKELCVGCELCVKACPKGLIQVTEKKNKVFVKCSSCDTAKQTMSVCKNGCIACKKCERTCEYDAIKVINNHASIDYDKCTSCGKCVDVCPVNCIKTM